MGYKKKKKKRERLDNLGYEVTWRRAATIGVN